MIDLPAAQDEATLVFEQDVDEAPDKVWRAIAIPAYRDCWLPVAMLAGAEAEAVTPGQELRYRLRDDEPPFVESTVVLRIAANADGGTRLTIIHTPVAPLAAANANRPLMMLAA